VENTEEIPPVPVVSVRRRSPFVAGSLSGLMWALLALSIFFVVRPRIVVETAGDQTTVRIDPAAIRRQVLTLIAAGVGGVLSVIVGARRWTVAGLVMSLVLPVAIWHQAVSRVIVTPDSLTAPLEARLFPGTPTTVRFDELFALRLYPRESSNSTFQYAYTKKGQVIRLEFGPLIDAAGPVIESRAAARGLGVQWEK
jgi:hypothetical protein